MPSSHQDSHPYGRSADDVRRRDQRRRRQLRLRATQLVFFSALAVAVIAVGFYAVGELREPAAEPGVIAPKTFGDEGSAELTCPEPGAVPLPAQEVTVTVLNGTGRTGLAGDVSEELAARGFALEDPGNTGEAAGPATIVHGPDGYLAAQSLSAQVPDATLTMDSREGAAVDLLLGDGFAGLEEEATASAAAEEPVEMPEGCPTQ
ncbi:LytR C-terminal domain-containing protein [Brachybacterium sp. GCM10030267]|uniref:LytR C-terminal domain-containing protein n=1 Tax=unclassified Brachybacterium TaxID=2623841 RepID=UPI0036126D82